MRRACWWQHNRVIVAVWKMNKEKCLFPLSWSINKCISQGRWRLVLRSFTAPKLSVFVRIFMFICCCLFVFVFFFNVFSPLTDGDRARCAWLQLSSEPLMQSSTEPVGGKNAFVTLNPCSVSTDDIIVWEHITSPPSPAPSLKDSSTLCLLSCAHMHGLLICLQMHRSTSTCTWGVPRGCGLKRDGLCRGPLFATM